MQNDPLITAALVREIFNFDPTEGVFRYRIRRSKMVPGLVAGSLKKNGYRIMRINGKFFQSARVAWLYHYGAWPKNEVDHLNQIRSDDRIANLRDVSRLVNSHNMRDTRANSTTGFTGVVRDPRNGRYYANIYKDGKNIFLGSFRTFEEAKAARIRGKQKYHHAPQPITQDATASFLGEK